ncbi:glycosyltransferase family 2 protein [Prosthecomicrobium pneumaticum]|uniref:Glycosyltransferase involved in cell wall biosynthesis n=1 Tax=Prosthecomicrobium pneumaticum TaxID=81895 RepID=A0A7W9CU07_9HYPH|nr:glycosyltransferase family 2 protein [Prosthecomicrobium pneumaticum]MBB5751880.1 glycosyltransferase involved in cell wall biosynthesis [Prosthecomicrobium pneumaticum]
MAEAFTVAICTRNRAAFLRRCLEGLAASLKGLDAPVLVVDNGSTDDTAAVVAQFGSMARRIVEPRVGLSHARNAAMAACSTAYLVFLDDDGIPSAEWGSAVGAVTKRAEADVFGGPYTPFYTSPKPAWFDDSFGSAHLELADGPQAASVCFSGGNMGWRVSVLSAAGGFDPTLGVSGDRLRLGEETALQLALRRSNPTLRFEFSSSMRMVHHVSREKMRLSYIHRRNYIYGYQLRDIDPANPINDLPLAMFVRQTKLGLPLLARLIWRRGLTERESWRRYAARYLSLNSILFGAQVRRWFAGARRRSPAAAHIDNGAAS